MSTRQMYAFRKTRKPYDLSFKEWSLAECEKLGIKYHALQMRLWKGTMPYPAGTVFGPSGRAMGVVTSRKY